MKNPGPGKGRSGPIQNLLLAGIMVFGIGLLLYPTISNSWNERHQSSAVAHYNDDVDKLDPEAFNALWNEAEEYNKGILKRGIEPCKLTTEEEWNYNSALNTEGNGIMGILEIPKIHVELPIRHGSSEEVLQVSAGHLEWSSLPTGGKGNHCVISGHRGLPEARLFTDLDQLQEGDIFILHVLDRDLYYRVDRIQTVLPADTQALLADPALDLCTLMTCTPYGINTHRLLVRGRAFDPAETESVPLISSEAVLLDPEQEAFAFMSFMLVIYLIWTLRPVRKN